MALLTPFKGQWHAERVVWFSHGFYALRQQAGNTLISDLRMGEAPDYTFTFNLGRPEAPAAAPQREAAAHPSLQRAWHQFRQRL